MVTDSLTQELRDGRQNFASYIKQMTSIPFEVIIKTIGFLIGFLMIPAGLEVE